MAAGRRKCWYVLEGRLLWEGVSGNAEKLYFYYYMSCDFCRSELEAGILL